MTYTMSVRVYEMGEDTFVEERTETLGEALKGASHYIETRIVNDPTLDEWTIVDVTGSDALFEVQWTCTEDDSSCDYILQVHKNEF